MACYQTSESCCAAQDVGGANALIPVIKELQRRSQVQVVVIACRKAVQVFYREGIEHRAIESLTGLDQGFMDIARRVLLQVAPDVLLLGTSWGASLDKVLVNIGHEQGVPSLAVLDMWSYYRERFADPASGELCFPTKVAVMDQLAFEQAMQAGLPGSSLVITGQPYLDELVVRLQRPDLRRQAESLRRAWLGDVTQQETARIVLFASEAFAQDFGPHTPYYRGYTEVDALEGLVVAVQLVEDGTCHKIMIVVKLHPEESPRSFRMGPLASQRSVRTVADQPAWPCIFAADVIVGMTSMFLIEAALAGKPTISFQPGVVEKNSFIGSQIGLVPAVSSSQELANLLKSCLTEKHTVHNLGNEKTKPPLTLGGAASRIANLVLDLACSKQE